MIVSLAVVFVACNDDPPAAPPKEYTVTFDSDGGSSVAEQKVNAGEKAFEPDDPVKDEYVFKGWFIGETKYDFDTPVTEDITLKAKWELSIPAPVMVTLTFDSDGGSEIEAYVVESGVVVPYPQANPTRNGYYFVGWFVGNEKYAFGEPLTEDVTVKAKWEDKQEVDNKFLAALQADYSNFTSSSTVTDASGSYTNVFKQTATTAYWAPDKEYPLYEDHLVIFNDEGKMLAMYYLHNGEWKKSDIIDCAEFVVALYLDEIKLDDAVYQGDGIYRIYDECVASVVYALFRSNDGYSDFYIQIADGRISKVWGNMPAEGGMIHEQTFYAFGETEIEIPSDLPAVSVSIETRTKETEVGTALDLNELINFLFVVKVEGKDYAINSDMVDLGDLNLDNPVAGNYAITLSFETWDGASHSETATVKVIVPQGDETFADIFAKDYSNVTITNDSNNTIFKYVNGCYFNPTASTVYYYSEEDNSITKYTYNASTDSATASSNFWFSTTPRVDMLFALSAELFEQDEYDENIYIAKNKEQILPVLAKNVLTKTNVVDQSKDYSITLTVSAGRVSKITFSYYYKANASSPTSSIRSSSYSLSNFDDTVIDIPDAISSLRGDDGQATAVTAYAEEKKY